MWDVEEGIEKLKDEVKTLEGGLNHQIVLFKSYTDNSDIIGKYEQTLSLLMNEGPLILSSLDKLKATEDNFSVFINDVLGNNVNYD